MPGWDDLQGETEGVVLALDEYAEHAELFVRAGGQHLWFTVTREWEEPDDGPEKLSTVTRVVVAAAAVPLTSPSAELATRMVAAGWRHEGDGFVLEVEVDFGDLPTWAAELAIGTLRDLMHAQPDPLAAGPAEAWSSQEPPSEGPTTEPDAPTTWRGFDVKLVTAAHRWSRAREEAFARRHAPLVAAVERHNTEAYEFRQKNVQRIEQCHHGDDPEGLIEAACADALTFAADCVPSHIVVPPPRYPGLEKLIDEFLTRDGLGTLDEPLDLAVHPELLDLSKEALAQAKAGRFDGGFELIEAIHRCQAQVYPQDCLDPTSGELSYNPRMRAEARRLFLLVGPTHELEQALRDGVVTGEEMLAEVPRRARKMARFGAYRTQLEELIRHAT